MNVEFLRRSFFALFLITAAAASAQDLTQAEKDRALEYLESTKQSVLETTRGLSDAQWNFKPAPDRWSVAQVMEHIAASEEFIRDNLLKEKVMISSSGQPGRDVKKIDGAVVTMIPDRTEKKQAPEPLQPRNRFGSPDGSLKHFLTAARRQSNVSGPQGACAIT